MTDYLHTFVVAAHGDSPYIEECIRSLKNQTAKSKINLVTSIPSPFLKQISAKYDITFIVNTQSKGIASDWSFAYKNCQTKYLTIAHQDDIYLPYYTKTCLSTALSYPDTLIIFTGYRELRENKTRLAALNFLVKELLLSPFLIKKSITSHFLKKMILSFGNPISCPTVMYNKENIGFLEFSNNFAVSLDWYEWLKLSKRKGSFVYIRKKTLLHRIHKETASSLKIINKVRKKEDEIIFKTIWPELLAKILSNGYYLASKSTMVN